jgi:hypothetical protein
MSLDSASYPALWQLYDTTGIRPEYILPVLWHESNFTPSVINSIGCAGINQMCAGALASIGVDAATYASWPASAQIVRGVIPYFSPHAGQLNSGARVYQAEFLPATLSTATGLDDIIAASTSAYYNANPSLDPDRTGAITLRTLAQVVTTDAQNSHVQQAIANAYALRPGESPQDPTFGTDFGGGVASSFGSLKKPLLISAGILAAGGLAWWLSLSPREKRRIRRMLPA